MNVLVTEYINHIEHFDDAQVLKIMCGFNFIVMQRVLLDFLYSVFVASDTFMCYIEFTKSAFIDNFIEDKKRSVIPLEDPLACSKNSRTCELRFLFRETETTSPDLIVRLFQFPISTSFTKVPLGE